MKVIWPAVCLMIGFHLLTAYCDGALPTKGLIVLFLSIGVIGLTRYIDNEQEAP